MNEEIELRVRALETAQQLENWGRYDTLIDNAAAIENYLYHGSKKKDVGVPTSIIDSLKLSMPDHGMVQFRRYNHQKILWSAIDNNKTLIVNAARQMGLSSLYAAYAVDYALKNSSSVVKIISNKFSAAKLLVFLFADQIEYKQRTQSSITFENNSIILCDTAKQSEDEEVENIEDHGMMNLLIIDNAAFIPFKHDEYLNDLIIGKVTDKCVVSSSPNINAGLFYNLWNTPSQFRTNLMIPWWMHENRDAVWAEAQANLMGRSEFLHSYGCQFKSKY